LLGVVPPELLWVKPVDVNVNGPDGGGFLSPAPLVVLNQLVNVLLSPAGTAVNVAPPDSPKVLAPAGRF
jgi:hypothetical protein